MDMYMPFLATSPLFMDAIQHVNTIIGSISVADIVMCEDPGTGLCAVFKGTSLLDDLKNGTLKPTEVAVSAYRCNFAKGEHLLLYALVLSCETLSDMLNDEHETGAMSEVRED